MNIAILATSILSAVMAVSAFFVCLRKQKRNRELMEFMLNRIEELDMLAAAGEEKLEVAAQRAEEQASRVSALEKRVEKLKSQQKENTQEQIFSEWEDAQRATSIREKRRRVISLADAGESTEEIAEHLGMLPGEVDLIINLSRADFTQIG